MKPVWAEQQRQRQLKIETVGMLLDANWSASRGIFIKVIRGEAVGFPVHHEEYYNEDGKRIGEDNG